MILYLVKDAIGNNIWVNYYIFNKYYENTLSYFESDCIAVCHIKFKTQNK